MPDTNKHKTRNILHVICYYSEIMISCQNGTVVKFAHIIIHKSNLLGQGSGATLVPSLLKCQMWIQDNSLSPLISVYCQFPRCFTQSFIDQFHNGVDSHMSMNQDLKIAWITFYVRKS